MDKEQVEAVGEAVSQWLMAQAAYIEAREQYRKAYGQAYIASQQKTADARKADADVLTSDLRLERDKAEANAAGMWQLMLAVRGPMDQSRIPGAKFGDAA